MALAPRSAYGGKRQSPRFSVLDSQGPKSAVTRTPEASADLTADRDLTDTDTLTAIEVHKKYLPK